jgi:hypothetical protein
MTRGEIFETTDIDLASFLVAASGRFPAVLRAGSCGLATFHFRRDMEIEGLVGAYSTGAVVANVRRLLAARRRLFHEVRRVQMEVKS